MSEAKHTPGPWRANERIAVVEQDEPLGLFVADCRMTDEGRSNARLIAAAPDLLAAVKEVRQWLGPDLFTSDDIYQGRAERSCAAMSAAIAKAEGAVIAEERGTK